MTDAEPVRPVRMRAIPEKGVIGVSLEFVNESRKEQSLSEERGRGCREAGKNKL